MGAPKTTAAALESVAPPRVVSSTTVPTATNSTAAQGNSDLSWVTLPGLPHLDVLPSREHRALGRLAVLAATARNSYEHHLASFVLYSASGLRGKTWLARWVALVLGASRSAVVHAGAESGRSLGARRRGSGEVAAVRAALSGPILAVDEFLRGEVRRMCMVLISGDKSIPLEDETMLVDAVIMLLMNSKKGAKTPEEATTLDSAMLRRCLVADLERLELDARFARDGEERLDRVRDLGAVRLPEIRPGEVDERTLRDRIADALEVVLDSRDRMGSLDLVLLGQLAVAACAWGLTPEDAVALVVHDCCVVWATTSWVRDGWESELARVLGRAVEVHAVAREGPQATAEDAAMDMPVEIVPPDLDWEARVARQDEIAIKHGAADPEILDDLLGLATAVRSVGLRAEDVAGLRELMRIVRGPDGRATERLRVLAALDELGVAPEDAGRLHALVAAGRLALMLGPEDVVLVARGIVEAGLDPHEVGAWAAWAMREFRRIDGALARAQAELRDHQSEASIAAAQVAVLRAQAHGLQAVLERAEADPELSWALRTAEAEEVRQILADNLRLAEEQQDEVA